MKLKKQIIFAAALILAAGAFAGCSGNDDAVEPPATDVPLVIETQPQSVAVNEGGEAVLSVSVAEGDSEELSYQWFQTEDPVNRTSDDIQIIGNEGEFIPPESGNGIEIFGATESTYIPPTDHTGVNSYYVEVSNGIEIAVSDAATVAVKPSNGESAQEGEGSDPVNIVFICGGNTGRSPMAAVIAEEVFAQKGIPAVIKSAGSDIIDGDRAEENAVTLMAERGLDLSDHVAQWWTPEMLEEADYVFVMTESHKNRVNVPTLGIYEDKVFLLREFVGDSGGVPDPFEEPMEAYIETEEILTDTIERLADMLAKEM